MLKNSRSTMPKKDKEALVREMAEEMADWIFIEAVSVVWAAWCVCRDLVYYVFVDIGMWVLTVLWRVSMWTPPGWQWRVAWRIPWMPGMWILYGYVSLILAVRFSPWTSEARFDRYEKAFGTHPSAGIPPAGNSISTAVGTLEVSCLALRYWKRLPEKTTSALDVMGLRHFITQFLYGCIELTKSDALTADDILRIIVVLTKLPYDLDKSWKAAVSLSASVLTIKAKIFIHQRTMSLFQILQYRRLLDKLVSMNVLIDSSSTSAEAYVRSITLKAGKAYIRSTIPRTCVLCGKPAERLCGRCKLVRYCSAQCQAHHWATTHKLNCVKGSLSSSLKDSSKDEATPDLSSKSDLLET